MTAIQMIEQERKRQVEKGFTAEHDDSNHKFGEIADAAACFAATVDDLTCKRCGGGIEYPFGQKVPRHHARIEELTIAGALIVAEIERLQRVEEKAAK